ncbi:unnamed protein product [Symbiodinium natans]|uniref:Uncharacterized protein n=1 Tax=Symbiodinium natans TaxID=878477 RepID=A0A812U0Y8_9DINO|nr:unnamed protein product [Symbiodinium natans]
MPFLTLSMDALAGLILKSQELPWGYAGCYFLGGVLGMTGGWGMVVMWLAVRLCDIPVGTSTSPLLDHGWTLLIFLGFVVLSFSGVLVSVRAYQAGLVPAGLWFLSTCFLLCLTRGGWERSSSEVPSITEASAVAPAAEDSVAQPLETPPDADNVKNDT